MRYTKFCRLRKKNHGLEKWSHAKQAVTEKIYDGDCHIVSTSVKGFKGNLPFEGYSFKDDCVRP